MTPWRLPDGLGEQVAAAETRASEAHAKQTELGSQMKAAIEEAVAEAEGARRASEEVLHAELRSQV